MGLYDTLVLPSPIACKACGAAIASTQTKELGQSMSTYRVGDVVSWRPFATGVLTEELYCPQCHRFDQTIHVTIWHSLLTGFYPDLAQAEAELLQVDRADILNHLMGHQKRETEHRRTLHELIGVLEDYIGYLKAPDKQDYLGGLWHLHLKEYLDTPDPLAGIVGHYKARMGESDPEDGIF